MIAETFFLMEVPGRYGKTKTFVIMAEAAVPARN